MEKKGTKIAYFVALAVVVVALVIAKVTNDGSGFVATGWALFPPVVAIALALISKEVYSSLFLGCLAGALLLANFQPWQMVVNFVGAGEGVGMINACLLYTSQLNDLESEYGVVRKYKTLPVRFETIIEAAYRKPGRQVVILVDEYDKPRCV